MKCQRVRSYLSLYIDSELDPATTHEVSRHLEACRECRRIFKTEESLEKAIAEQLREPEGDEQAVLSRALDSTHAVRSRSGMSRRSLTLAILLLIVGLFVFVRMRSAARSVPALVQQLASDHRDQVQGRLALEIHTKDPRDLLPFFRGKLVGRIGPFPTGQGWEIEGARLCHFGDIPVSYVTLRYHGTPVSVIDLPKGETGLAERYGSLLRQDNPCYELPGGLGIIRPTATGVRAVFGDVDQDKLEEVVRAAQ